MSVKLTRKQAVENEKRKWLHIAEKTRLEKRCVDEEEAIKGIWGDVKVLGRSWHCEYVDQLDSCCDSCPVVWGNAGEDCESSEFGKWRDAYFDDDWERAADLAEKIANLPERKGVS